MTTLQALRRGRKRIVAGWCRGEFRKKIGKRTCYCAVGAIQVKSEGNSYPHTGAYQSLKEECLLFNVATLLDPVVDFNDRQKDKRPVVRLYDRAIAAELERR